MSHVSWCHCSPLHWGGFTLTTLFPSSSTAEVDPSQQDDIMSNLGRKKPHYDSHHIHPPHQQKSCSQDTTWLIRSLDVITLAFCFWQSWQKDEKHYFCYVHHTTTRIPLQKYRVKYILFFDMTLILNEIAKQFICSFPFFSIEYICTMSTPPPHSLSMSQKCSAVARGQH